MSYTVAQRCTMSANAVVRARIDARIKSEATAVLASVGLTVSDAFRLLLTRVAREKALPFEAADPQRGDDRGHAGGAQGQSFRPSRASRR